MPCKRLILASPFFFITTIAAILTVSGFIFAMITQIKIQTTRSKQSHQQALWQQLQNNDFALDKHNLEVFRSQIKMARNDYTHNVQKLLRPEAIQAIDEGLPSNALGLYFSLKNLQSDLVQLAEKINNEANTSQDSTLSEKEPYVPRIIINPNETFSFGAFLKNGKGPSRAEAQKHIYQQRQIIHFLISTLFLTTQETAASLELKNIFSASTRETLKTSVSPSLSPYIDKRLSPSTIDEVNTLAFQLSFITNTHTFRSFLNKLATSSLPLVVNSIEVKRAHQKRTRQNNANAKDSVAVVTNTLSEFIMTIEYLTLLSESHSRLTQDAFKKNVIIDDNDDKKVLR